MKYTRSIERCQEDRNNGAALPRVSSKFGEDGEIKTVTKEPNRMP